MSFQCLLLLSSQCLLLVIPVPRLLGSRKKNGVIQVADTGI
ncbi:MULTISPECIES: hypothetical protein [unclassified Wolbachia]|nr:hypothetical protein [Wolbachia endosymbiont of Cardiocondyla obscurior]